MASNKHYLDIVSKRFGRLVVIEDLGMINPYKKSRNYHYYKCVCDCGKEKIVQRTPLLRGDTRSCGCMFIETIRKTGKNNRKKKGESALNSLFGSYKRDAKRKGVIFEITKEKFKEITKQDCIFCGSKPKNSHQHSGIYGPYIYNGIDRIDSVYGYSDFNCVPACKRCNQMKNDMPVSEFIERIENILNKMR